MIMTKARHRRELEKAKADGIVQGIRSAASATRVAYASDDHPSAWLNGYADRVEALFNAGLEHLDLETGQVHRDLDRIAQEVRPGEKQILPRRGPHWDSDLSNRWLYEAEWRADHEFGAIFPDAAKIILRLVDEVRRLNRMTGRSER